MKKYTLKNGLRVVLEDIPTIRSVSIGIWVRTGSRYEAAANNGVSHFIEHMLFKGTYRFSARQIAEQFDRIGGNVNAFTDKEYTCYYAKVLDRHAEFALDILADMYFHSLISQEELNKEKKVILEEIAMYEDTPDDLVHDLIAKSVYGDHALGFPVLGSIDNINKLTAEDLHHYKRNHYRMDNTVISVAGHIDDGLLAHIEHLFGGYQTDMKPCEVNSPKYIGTPIFQEKDTEQHHLCMALPGISLQDDHLYAMSLLNNVIGGSMSSRLFQEVREERGLAYSIYSYHTAFADDGLLTIYAGTAPDQTEDVIKVTMEVLASLKQHRISEDELLTGKEQLKGNFILSLESTSNHMNRIGKNELMAGKHFSVDEVLQKIDAIEHHHIEAVIQRLFSKPLAIALIGEENDAILNFRRDQFVTEDTNKEAAG